MMNREEEIKQILDEANNGVYECIITGRTFENEEDWKKHVDKVEQLEKENKSFYEIPQELFNSRKFERINDFHTKAKRFEIGGIFTHDRPTLGLGIIRDGFNQPSTLYEVEKAVERLKSEFVNNDEIQSNLSDDYSKGYLAGLNHVLGYFELKRYSDIDAIDRFVTVMSDRLKNNTRK